VKHQVNKRAAAEFFGVSVQALDGWFLRGAPAGEKVGRNLMLDLSALARWRIGQESGSELEVERTRLTKAQADKTEMESAELAGVLVRVGEVAEYWARSSSAVRARLLSMPAKIGPRARVATNDQEAAAIVEAEVIEALQELSADGIPDTARARRERNEKRISATADPDGEPVGGRVPKAVKRKRGRAGAVEN
jgi:phage terminase Nu1 subunit (DNA packaging protein)